MKEDLKNSVELEEGSVEDVSSKYKTDAATKVFRGRMRDITPWI